MRSRRSVIVLLSMVLGCSAPPAPRPDAGRIREARALIDRGTVELRRGNLEAADAAYGLALELAPLAAALDGLGCVAFLSGDTERAEILLRHAVAIEPENSEALANLALLYEAEGETERAEALYRAALHAEPRNFRARNNFAAFLVRRNDRTLTEEARAQLRKAYSVAHHRVIELNLEEARGIEANLVGSNDR